jgi:hypothetical protein
MLFLQLVDVIHLTTARRSLCPQGRCGERARRAHVIPKRKVGRALNREWHFPCAEGERALWVCLSVLFPFRIAPLCAL